MQFATKKLGHDKFKFLREAFNIAIECTREEGDPFIFYEKLNHILKKN